MEFFLVILIVFLLIRWAIIRSRFKELEDRVQEAMAGRNQRDEVIAGLIQRVYALEHPVQPIAPAAPVAKVEEPVAVPEPEPLPVVALVIPEPVQHFELPPLPAEAEPVPAEPEPKSEPELEPVLEPVFASPEPEPPRPRMGGQEWEALVGGNWLNKVGVLLVVIGVALLMSFGFTQTGPAGRVGIGLLVSIAMLAAGVVFERREGYAMFARGLLGGGWAALYFTTYAMHGVDAARVVENPYVASGLLLAVAAGMIIHSLRYRSQTVTGLAYFIAFATLVLADVTTFAVAALIPLAGSLLFVAYRFSWFAMAFFGLFATYGTLISRGDSGAPLSTTQATFFAFWLLFEVFDLLRTARRDEDIGLTRFILPLNTIAFVFLSWQKWLKVSPHDLYIFFSGVAALYFVSAMLRLKLRPPSSFDGDAGTLARVSHGGYEGAITVAAILTAFAILVKAPTVWINAGLLIEGELLFLASVRFGQPYLGQLATLAFGVSLAKLAWIDLPAAGTTTLAGLHMQVWTPVAAAHTAIFYLNRMLRSVARHYSWAAAVLVCVMLAAELPQQYIGAAYLVFAVVLFEFGFRKQRGEFRYQAYAAGLVGATVGFVLNVIEGQPSWRMQWLPIAIETLISYAAAVRVRRFDPDRMADWEAASLRRAGSAAATIFSMALIWKLVPGDYLGLAWLALSALLLELGLRGFPRELRWSSYAAWAIGFGRVLGPSVFEVNKNASIAERITLAGAALVCYAISARVFRSNPDRVLEIERCWVRDLNSFAATTFLLTVSWVVLPDAVVAVGWALAGLALLEVGFSSAVGSFRLLGSLVAKIVFFRLFFANFTDLGHTGFLSHRLLTVLPIILSEYYIWWRYRHAEVSERERTASRLYLYAPVILAVILSRFELGRALTVTGWAGITLALYGVGVRRQISDLRWQSYAVALLTCWRCWDTNFYIPESLAGMPGRVFTGALVVASLYGAQLLSPRSPDGMEARPNIFVWFDQHARLVFSILASGLLAALLYYEVSGGILTVAWTVQAMAMLVAGFPLRDRPLRLSGLLLFLACILKVFLWDLRHLETLQRIMSFIVLGLILVGVSWMYTRFRDRIQRYL